MTFHGPLGVLCAMYALALDDDRFTKMEQDCPLRPVLHIRPSTDIEQLLANIRHMQEVWMEVPHLCTVPMHLEILRR